MPPLDHWATIATAASGAILGVVWMGLKMYAQAKKLLHDQERDSEIADAQAKAQIAKSDAEAAEAEVTAKKLRDSITSEK